MGMTTRFPGPRPFVHMICAPISTGIPIARSLASPDEGEKRKAHRTAINRERHALLPSLPFEHEPRSRKREAHHIPARRVRNRLQLRNNLRVFPYCRVNGSTSGGVGTSVPGAGPNGASGARSVSVLSQGSCPWAVPAGRSAHASESAAASRIHHSRTHEAAGSPEGSPARHSQGVNNS